METILIQEPDNEIMDIVTIALSIRGYRACRLTHNEKNVLELIHSSKVDMIIMDCWLARYSGRFCHWIKAHCPDLPLIAFSCDTHIDQHFRSLGFDDYLKKPFELDDLYQLIEKYVRIGNKKLPSRQAVN